MNARPELNGNIDSKTFNDYYYLKRELIDFCRKNNLPTVGSKQELIDEINTFLDKGERSRKSHSKTIKHIFEITLDTLIEDNFICSEKHRIFYKQQIGNNFTFNVPFQKWLKNNPGKTYKDSIDAYYQIVNNKKSIKTTIDKQFEYNTYIRDFFSDNKGLTLQDAIKCWKYKKTLKGHNKYEKEDLIALK